MMCLSFDILSIIFRTKFYENADIHVSLEGNGVDAETGAPTAVVMYRILKKVKAKIEATKEVRLPSQCCHH